jgi:hypothetical protein
MAPPLIWVHALATEQFATAKKVRAIAHGGIKDIKIDDNRMNNFAARHYFMHMQVIKWRADGLFRINQSYPFFQMNEDFRNGTRRASALSFSTIAETLTLYLTSGSAWGDTWVAHAAILLDTLNRYETHSYLAMSTKMRLQLRHMDLLVYMAENPDSRVSEVHDALRSHVQDMSSITPHYQQAAHDLDVLKPLLDVKNAVMYR